MRQDTFNLRAGYIATVTADAGATGSYLRQPDSGGTYSATDIAASSTTTVGPFTTNRNYLLTSYTGALTYSIAQADLATTGTGDHVRATSPTISAPTLSGGPLGTQSVTLAAASGALTIAAGLVVFTKAGVAAMTLAAPTAAQNGTIMRFTSNTANAHTITATGLIQDGVTGGPHDLATFGAFLGASLTLIAYNLTWHVLSKNVCTIS